MVLRVNALYDAMDVSLAALQPPEADTPLIDSWLDGQRAQSPIAIREARALIHGKVKQAKRLHTQVRMAVRNTQAIVAGYGFSYCNYV